MDEINNAGSTPATTELAVTSETTSVNPAEKTKTFTQEEFDEKLAKRVYKEAKWFLDKLGVEKKEDIDGLVEKLNRVKDYDDLKAKNVELETSLNELKSEKTKSQYLRVIEKANVDDEVVELVYSKVSPQKDESLETYQKRVDDYLKDHSNFVKNTTLVNTSINLSGRNITNNPNQRMNNFIRGKE